MSDMALIKIVRLALEAIDFRAPDMSPRVLRNTHARRLLLAGRTNEEVSALLGLERPYRCAPPGDDRGSWGAAVVDRSTLTSRQRAQVRPR